MVLGMKGCVGGREGVELGDRWVVEEGMGGWGLGIEAVVGGEGEWGARRIRHGSLGIVDRGRGVVAMLGLDGLRGRRGSKRWYGNAGLGEGL
ncbi:unnamed protein product [Prunus armeniaca]